AHPSGQTSWFPGSAATCWVPYECRGRTCVRSPIHFRGIAGLACHRLATRRVPRRAMLHWPLASGIRETRAMRSRRLPHPRPAPSSAFAGFRFPPEVITLAVRWYLRFGLSYRDVEELLAERGIEVD